MLTARSVVSHQYFVTLAVFDKYMLSHPSCDPLVPIKELKLRMSV